MGIQHPRSEELAYGYVTVGNTDVVSYSGTVAGQALSANKMYRVVADGDVFISFGSSNDATTSAAFLPSGVVEYFGTDDTNTTISVISSGGTGSLYVTEMTPAKAWIV